MAAILAEDQTLLVLRWADLWLGLGGHQSQEGPSQECASDYQATTFQDATFTSSPPKWVKSRLAFSSARASNLTTPRLPTFRVAQILPVPGILFCLSFSQLMKPQIKVIFVMVKAQKAWDL